MRWATSSSERPCWMRAACSRSPGPIADFWTSSPSFISVAFMLLNLLPLLVFRGIRKIRFQSLRQFLYLALDIKLQRISDR